MAANAGFTQDANRTNAGFTQDANQFNATSQNALRAQGFQMGGDQLQANLNRTQDARQFNTRSFNDARAFGSELGANAFNNAQQGNQFGASLAATLGNQGANNVNMGANLYGFGNNMQLGAGNFQQGYDQSLQNLAFRQGMAPYQNLEFYNRMIGSPNNLSQGTASSQGKSSGFNLSFGKQE
jgi:hypothetical protein